MVNRPLPRLLSDPTPALPGADGERRRALAAELDAQGVYPPAWTTATRAPWSKQALYRQTGFHDSSRHFLANGELYERANNPALKPSPEQAAESLKAYLGKSFKPIHEIVPVDRMPLTHPVGRKLTPNSPEQAAAMARQLATQSVNHATWHQGDPVAPEMQNWIVANGYKTSDIYQGPDGWHYRRNEKTLESPEVTALRIAENAKSKPADFAKVIAGASPDPANAKVAEKILVDWHMNAPTPQPPVTPPSPANDNAKSAAPASTIPASTVPASTMPASTMPASTAPMKAVTDTAAAPISPDNQSIVENTPAKDIPLVSQQRAALGNVATALDKLKRNEKPSPEEQALLSGVQQSAQSAGLKLDLSKLDPELIRRMSGNLDSVAPAASTAIAIPFSTPIGAPAAIPEAAGAAATMPRIIGITAAATSLAPIATFLAAMGAFATRTESPEDDALPALRTRISPDIALENPPPPVTPAIPLLPPPASPEGPSNGKPEIRTPPAIPEALKPFIDTIPAGENEFLKPSVTPGWNTLPDFLTDGILSRWGGPDTRRRNILCRDEGERIFNSLGYEIKDRFGDEDGEHWFPNAEGGHKGGGYSDAGLHMKDPDGQPVTWHLNTYTANATGPINRELASYARILENWLRLSRNEVQDKLSKTVLKNYDWAIGAMAMVAKGKKGEEHDAEFMQACRAAILNQIDENGRLIPDKQFLPQKDDK